jgi:hypothetical protein
MNKKINVFTVIGLLIAIGIMVSSTYEIFSPDKWGRLNFYNQLVFGIMFLFFSLSYFKQGKKQLGYLLLALSVLAIGTFVIIMLRYYLLHSHFPN